MKKIIVFCALLFCTAAIAQTINWYVDGSVYQTTTCNSGDSITPPTPPAKHGYTFQGWRSYTPIEYIESTGTQWIDTGIVGKTGISTEIKLLITSGNSGCALGSGSASSQFHPTFWYNEKWDSVVGSDRGTTSVNFNVIYTTRFESDASGYRFYVDGVLNNSGSNTINTNLTMYLFKRHERNGGTSTYQMSGQIYYVKIWDNNILVRDFIPMLDLNDTPCMYDKVSKTFFYNAGTGNFIAGPVVNE